LGREKHPRIYIKKGKTYREQHRGDATGGGRKKSQGLTHCEKSEEPKGTAYTAEGGGGLIKSRWQRRMSAARREGKKTTNVSARRKRKKESHALPRTHGEKDRTGGGGKN